MVLIAVLAMIEVGEVEKPQRQPALAFGGISGPAAAQESQMGKPHSVAEQPISRIDTY